MRWICERDRVQNYIILREDVEMGDVMVGEPQLRVTTFPNSDSIPNGTNGER